MVSPPIYIRGTTSLTLSGLWLLGISVAHLEHSSRSAYAVGCGPSSVCPSVVSVSHFRELHRNCRLDWANTWWEVSRQHGHLELFGYVTIFKMAAMVAILKFIKWNFLLYQKSDLADTWWEASVWHEDSELLKSFCLVIKGGHLKILQKKQKKKKKKTLLLFNRKSKSILDETA